MTPANLCMIKNVIKTNTRRATVMISPNEQLFQATATAELYLRSAIKSIDSTLGEGYAKDNPALITAFMRVCDSDFQFAVKSCRGKRR